MSDGGLSIDESDPLERHSYANFELTSGGSTSNNQRAAEKSPSVYAVKCGRCPRLVDTAIR
jgi:hypothetical protein